MKLGKAQELYDELMKLESKLRDIRYGSDYLNRDTSVWTLSAEAIQLKSKLENFQLDLEFTLSQLFKKRQALYLKGCNDEKLNDKIRAIQHKLRFAN